jgi:hypothetical protein
MWADTLQSVERQHLYVLLLWGGASALIGVLLLVILRLRRIRAPLLLGFALQYAIWGTITLLWSAASYRHVPLRDYEGAVSLARALWITIGLEAGAVLVGLTLVIAGWALGKRFGTVGAGVGVVVQAGALLILDLVFVRGIRL